MEWKLVKIEKDLTILGAGEGFVVKKTYLRLISAT